MHITFIPHTTTFDQENGVASGHFNTELSPAGKKEARALAKLLAHHNFDAVFSSDLRRAMQTARLALPDHNIITDRRLREVDYGRMTHSPREALRLKKVDRIHTPYPDGESYNDVIHRYKDFLGDVIRIHPNQHIAICAHGVYPLEVIINKAVPGDVLNNKSTPFREFAYPETASSR